MLSLHPNKTRNLIHKINGSSYISLPRISQKLSYICRQIHDKFQQRVETFEYQKLLQLNMASTSSYMASTKFSTLGWIGGKRELRNRRALSISAQQQPEVQESEQVKMENEQAPEQEKVKQQRTPLRPVEKQVNVESKNMGLEYGGQWLSSVTRHVRIYAAYIDPETWAFDQTQMDKLTIILDPTNEFLWNDETCNMVYSYFQELVDHYEGAPLTEYTLRLIGSDIEHYIRKLLYDGVIKYNMDSRVLNFSMGKPRILFNNNNDGQLQDVP